MSVAEDDDSKLEEAPLLTPGGPTNTSINVTVANNGTFVENTIDNLSSFFRERNDSVGSDGSHNSGFIHERVQNLNRNYPLWMAGIFLLNYGVGPGLYALPKVFYQTGYILAPLVLFWTALISYVTYKYVCNLVYRAEVLTSLSIEHGMVKENIYDNPQGIIEALSIIVIESTSANNTIGTTNPLASPISSPVGSMRTLPTGATTLSPQQSSEQIQRAHSNLQEEQMHREITISDFRSRYQLFYKNEYELSQLIGIFCGRNYRYIYEVLYFFLQLTQLWSFVVLFAESMTRFVGIDSISDSCRMDGHIHQDCRNLYTFYCCIFWVWAVFIVLLNFSQQQYMQLLIFCFRIVGFSYMFATSIGLIWGQVEYNSNRERYIRDRSDTPHYGDDLQAFKFTGFFSFVMVAVFGYGSQFSVPDIIEPLRKSDQRRLSLLFGSAMTFYFVIFFICGVSISSFFGEDAEDPCTLAWYRFKGYSFHRHGSGPTWAKMISWTVVLLPPIGALSTYPLNAITFANTIEQSLLNEEEQKRPKWKIIIRVIVVTVSVLLSMLVWDYGAIVDVSGLCVLLALYLLPAIAELKSQEMCDAVTVDDDNTLPHDNTQISQKNTIDSNYGMDDDDSDNGDNEIPAYITPVTDWTSRKEWIYATIGTAIVASSGLIIVFFTRL